MQIHELTDEISKLFRGFDVQAWEPRYRQALREGPNLRVAWDATMRGWKKTTFPRPAEIAAHIPGARPAKSRAVGEPERGPPYHTPERILWDKVRKEVRGLPVVWMPGDYDRAREAGYFTELADEAWAGTYTRAAE